MTIGDEEAGFTVAFDPERGLVHVRAWGFWDAEVAASFGSVVREACRDRPRGTPVRMDMTALKPMRSEGQAAFEELLRSLPGLGIGTVEVNTAMHLTRLQLTRLAGPKSDFVQIT